MIVDIGLPDILDYQREAIFCPERFAVIEATTKAGKTLGCILWLLERAGRPGDPGREFWWVAPVYEQARIAYDRTRELLRQGDPQQEAWKSNEQKMALSLCNGATIRFKSADNPDSLYGEDVLAAVMDEASRAKEEAWHAVRSTLTATGGAGRIIGNVKGRKNWAYTLARRAEAGALEGWRYAKITCADAVRAKIIPQEEVDAAQRELPEHVFRELYYAEPSEDGSNPFGARHIAACVRPISERPAQDFGVDLARKQDYTVVIGLDNRGYVSAFDRWQHEPWSRTQERVVAMVGEAPTLADASGVGDPVVEAMQKHCPQIEGRVFTATSKQQLMEGLAVAIQSGDVGFPDGPIRSELECFEYAVSRTGKPTYTAPPGMHDDCVMALALAVQRRATRPTFYFGSVAGGREEPEPALPDGKPTGFFAEMEERRKDINFGFGD